MGIFVHTESIAQRNRQNFIYSACRRGRHFEFQHLILYVRSDAALGGQKRAREIVRATSDTEQKGSTSEENSTCSDVSFVVTETESDDTSTDEQISTEDNASNSTGSEQDDSQISRPDAQPETIEKNGVVWTSQKSMRGV
ncbi:unnamed protein product [Adineta ricciae]|uniref:Uncharacterized protein n=1 Tax=Adineta ricciae TaxID=249248 RepID=A0A814Z4Q9_ADIRI|nr:unnamed protein product [Adineta ricciae]